MPTLTGKIGADHLGLTRCKGTRTGLGFPKDGARGEVLVQFLREDGTTTPSYLLDPEDALNLAKLLVERVLTLDSPELLAKYMAARSSTEGNHPDATP